MANRTVFFWQGRQLVNCTYIQLYNQRKIELEKWSLTLADTTENILSTISFHVYAITDSCIESKVRHCRTFNLIKDVCSKYFPELSCKVPKDIRQK
jgi:hypothetical protein